MHNLFSYQLKGNLTRNNQGILDMFVTEVNMRRFLLKWSGLSKHCRHKDHRKLDAAMLSHSPRHKVLAFSLLRPHTDAQRSYDTTSFARQSVNWVICQKGRGRGGWGYFGAWRGAPAPQFMIHFGSCCALENKTHNHEKSFATKQSRPFRPRGSHTVVDGTHSTRQWRYLASPGGRPPGQPSARAQNTCVHVPAAVGRLRVDESAARRCCGEWRCCRRLYSEQTFADTLNKPSDLCLSWHTRRKNLIQGR